MKCSIQQWAQTCLNILPAIFLLIQNLNWCKRCWRNTFSLLQYDKNQFHRIISKSCILQFFSHSLRSQYFVHLQHTALAVRLVTGTRCSDHISPVLRQLHWLPVRQRVDFKVATLVHQTLSGISPPYLAYDCRLVADARKWRLRSTASRTCVVTRTYSTFGDRAFGAAGPGLWNSLPSHLKDADISYSEFRRSLKTFLFGQWGHGAVWTVLTAPTRNILTYLLTAPWLIKVDIDKQFILTAIHLFFMTSSIVGRLSGSVFSSVLIRSLAAQIKHAPKYTVSGKKWTNSILGITSSNTGQFSKFFQCHNLLEICNNTVIIFPTTPQTRRYTTLWKTDVR